MPDIAPLDKRTRRYERILSLRNSQKPAMPYEEIGLQLDPPLSKERVRQILAAGRPNRAGRPSSPERVNRLRGKLATWERRRAASLAKGRSTAAADVRIAELLAELERVG